MTLAIKETAKKVIDTLPDNTTMDDIIHALYVNIKFAHGESEIRNGRGVLNQDAKKRLEKWLR